MAEFIEFLSESALAELKIANSELVKMVSNVENVSKKMQSISTPSGSDSAVKNLSIEYAKQQKLIASMQIQLERYAQAQNRTKISNNALEKSEISLEQARARNEKALQRENEKLSQANSLYNQTQQKVNELSKLYNDLAIKKELGANLTTKELSQLHKLTNEINTYQTALKKVDADIQKNQRNVGNYASGWNGLGNSINQLSREMPAFVNSVQTGFMALSNNLPILFDEINKIKTSNKELIAQGQPIKSTFSQIAGAILSWQTLLSVGVTLLTLYGAKLWDSISGSEKKKKALEAEKKAIEEKVEAERRSNETIGQSIAQEQNRARILFEIAKNEEVSNTKRKQALDEIRSKYSKYLGDLTDEQILAGQTAEAEERLNKALIGRGYALATQNLLEQNATAQMTAQVEYQKQLFKGFKAINEQKNDKGAIKNNEEYFASLRKTNKANTDAERILNAKLKPLKEEEELLLNLFRDNAKYLDAVNEQTAGKRKKIEAIKLEKETNDGLLGTLIKLKSATESQRDSQSNTNEEYRYFTTEIERLQRLIDALTSKNGALKDSAEKSTEEFIRLYGNMSKTTQKSKELEYALKSLFQTTANGALSSFGMDSLIPMFDGTFNKMWETAKTFNEKFAVGMKYIGDVAKETFEFINQQQQAQYDAQYQRLEQEKDIALLFAGESATAREEIERQYEERRKQIQRRQAEAQKKMAIFNSIINTAQGITSALAMTPPNIPLSIAIGVIGAVQTAIIASQQIPQFYKGTDNAPEGWAYTQEKGAEIITDKNGKIKTLGSNKGAELTYLNKGDKVYTAQQTSLMFDNNLNEILTNNGILMPKVNINVDNQLTNAKLDAIADAIKTKETIQFNYDKKGFELFKKEQGSKIKMNNLRLRTKGYDV